VWVLTLLLLLLLLGGHLLQAAVSDPAVGVAVWVRLLLPQLLGILELPAATAAGGSATAAAAVAGASKGSLAELLQPLDVSLQVSRSCCCHWPGLVWWFVVVLEVSCTAGLVNYQLRGRALFNL
jgi:hypothetical protein